MKNLFNSIKLTKPKRNRFDLSHDVKLSCKMGDLIPIMATECVPGDKFNIGCEALVRMAPLVSPMMHRVDVTMHYFFVPNRIVWPNWEKWIVNGPNPPAFPYLNIGTSSYTKLCDYLGIPTPPPAAIAESISALPFAAYQCIYNEYYRDQNLVTELGTLLSDGNNNSMLANWTTLRKRAWEHDYFTSALPFAQKGAAVDIPLGSGDVELKDGWNLGNAPHWENPDGASGTGAITQDSNPSVRVASDASRPAAYDPNGTLEVNLEPTTINDLRRAFRLQEWLEKNARGGTRYIENILTHFGVRSSDKRLQRPEYITGIKSPVQISEVLNTTGTEDAPQGNMAGHGVSVTTGKYGSYYCEEHGYIIGIMSVMPKTAYQQGIPKHFLKHTDPFQYYWPSFAHIGEQEIQNREIYAWQGAAGSETFGYVPRYAEYKFENNRVAGDFKNTLAFWHMGRIFDNPPSLNADFITSNPTTRVFAVEDPNQDNLYCHVYNKVSALRPMPKFGTPSF